MGRNLHQAARRKLSKGDFVSEGNTLTSYQVNDLIAEVTKEVDVLVFMFDDFDVLAAETLVEISNNLRWLLQSFAGSVVYITALHQPLLSLYKELVDKNQPLNFSPLLGLYTQDPIYLGAITDGSEKSLSKYIYGPSSENNLHFTQADEEFIRQAGGGYPSLTRLVCEKVFDERAKEGIGSLDYDQISEQLKEESEPIFLLIKSMLSPKQLEEVEGLLYQQIGAADAVRKKVDQYMRLGLITIRNDIVLPFSPLWPIVSQQEEKGPENVEKFILNEEARIVRMGNKSVKLSPNEWKILAYLIENKNRACSREELSALLEDDKSTSPTGSLEVTVSRLRKKVELVPGTPQYILTVRGHGYRFEEGAEE
jgi:two-component system alkaline phosphatase synthesis response regulator PhoP